MIVHKLLGKETYYDVLEEGEWAPATSVFACCDCGLVHDINYRMQDGKLYNQLFRNNKRTSAIRRGRKSEIAKRIGIDSPDGN
jgi:hypothetical protein